MPILLIISLWFGLLASPALGATVAEPSYRQLTLTGAHPASSGFVLALGLDEDRCKQRYGKRWRVKCAIPLGRPGEVARGVRMTPHAPGQWQWQDSSTLTFVPLDDKAIKPDTLYTVDLTSLPRSDTVIFDKTSIAYRTLPLAAQLNELRFFTDPSPRRAHQLALALDFNYPVPDNAVSLAVHWPAGVAKTAPRLIWNSLRDNLHASWPISTLPPSTAPIAIDLKGAGQLVRQEDELRFIPQATFSTNLPGADGLFAIAAMRLTPEVDAQLNQHYVLEVDTSLHAAPEQMLSGLTLLELPKFHGTEAMRPFDWSSVPSIPAAAIAQAKKLRPEPLQKAHSVHSTFRFRVPVDSGSYLLATVAQGTKAASGQVLQRAAQAVLHAQPLESRVGFLQPGNILSPDSNIICYENDVDALEWQLRRIRDPFLALLAQASSTVFSAPFDRLDVPLSSFSESVRGRLDVPTALPGRSREVVLPIAESLAAAGLPRSGLVQITLTGLKEGQPVAQSSRLVLLTDLQLLVKRTPDRIHAFVCRRATGSPIQAEVHVLGSNGKVVAQGQSDSRGHIHFPSLASAVEDERPVALVARLGEDLTFMPLVDGSRRLDLANFPVGGNHVGPDGVVAYIFDERGLYRPGDTLHFGIMPRRGDFARLPADLPLWAELVDPRGAKVMEQLILPGDVGLADVAWPSPADALSGKYRLDIKTSRAGAVIGTHAVRVESFLPDTLRMRLTPPASKGWLVTGDIDHAGVMVHLQNLFGTPAAGHQVKGRVIRAPVRFEFPGYAQWTFTDPAPFVGSDLQREIPPMTTDSAGACEMPIPVELLGRASARLTLVGEGFDAAGARATVDSTSLLVSPARRILGYKLTGDLTNLDFIPLQSDARIDFLAVDNELEPVPWDGLHFTLFSRSPITNLVADGQGGYRYDETFQDIALKTWRQSIGAQGASVALPHGEAGEFLLQVRDDDGHLLASIPYNVVGEQLFSDATTPTASKMRMHLNKGYYASGEELAIALTVPYESHGLLTIERDEVFAFEWVSLHPGENVVRMALPKEFEGRGYVVATLARATTSPIAYMSPLSSAAAPFTAGVQPRDMRLRVHAPTQSQPGQVIKVEVSAAKPGKALVYAVDEGILQLAAYQLPRPLLALLENRALDVTTLQTLDLLMPPGSAVAPRVSAFGGGSDRGAFGMRIHNPFRRKQEPPVVFWSGLIDMAGGVAQVEIPVPAWYAGSVRIMAVGAASEAAGSAQAICTVAGAVSISPVLPMVVCPGDFFTGSLIVANTTPDTVAGRLTVHLPAGLRWRTPPSPSFTLNPLGEKIINFQLVAEDGLGNKEIQFLVETARGNFGRSAALSLRPPAPLRTTIQAGIAWEGQTLPPPRAMYPEGAKMEALAAPVPIPFALGLGAYLRTYPYGCTEQLTSRAFAQVLLTPWLTVEQNPATPAERERLLSSAATALATRFQEGMGVALWAQGDADLLLSAYALDYLLVAREQGFGVNELLLLRLSDAVAWTCSLREPNWEAARSSAYALWVLAREGRVVTQLLENLQHDLDSQGPSGWRNDITGVLMSAAMREMGMTQGPLWSKLVITPAGWFDQLAQSALAMTVVARYFPEALAPAQGEDFINLVDAALNSNGYATFSAVQAIRAIITLASQKSGRDAIRIMCQDAPTTQSAEEGPRLVVKETGLCRRYVLNFPEGTGPVFWQISSTGFDREGPQKAENQGISVERKLLNGRGEVVSSITQGEQLTVRIVARASQPLAQCVISDLLAGGLEQIRQGGETALPAAVKHVERQEDRVMLFADLGPEPLEFSYRVRAVNVGEFFQPPIAAEAMYQPTYAARGPAGHVTIVAP